MIHQKASRSFELWCQVKVALFRWEPWSKYPLLAHNFIALSAMNFSAREQLWSPLRNKGWPGIHFILAKEGINPVSRHHPSANKNWFHPSFFATMTCHVLQPLFLPCSYYSLRIGFWLLPDFRKKQQKSLQININNSPDQQERSGPTPNSVSKKALGTKQSLPFDSQGR